MTGRLILFWDFDSQWGADRSRSPGGPKAWGMDDFTNTERLLEIHQTIKVPVCFAVVGKAADAGARPYADQALIKKISDAGHEIASHSLYHEWLPESTPVKLEYSLKTSKHLLENCIGAPVTTFVPPFNQPFDYPAKGSISLSERRAVPEGRVDLGVLGTAASAAGYTFMRVSYETFQERLFGFTGKQRGRPPSQPEEINGIWALRLNTYCGFGQDSRRMVMNVIRNGGYAIVYGHPHSLTTSGPQGENTYLPFLEWVSAWQKAEQLEIVLPRDVFTAQSIEKSSEQAYFIRPTKKPVTAELPSLPLQLKLPESLPESVTDQAREIEPLLDLETPSNPIQVEENVVLQEAQPSQFPSPVLDQIQEQNIETVPQHVSDFIPDPEPAPAPAADKNPHSAFLIDLSEFIRYRGEIKPPEDDPPQEEDKTIKKPN